MDKLAKIHRHRGKERLKISKVTKFESDRMKTNKDMAPQSRKFLYTFVWRGASLCPHHTNVCKISRLSRAISSLLSDQGWIQAFCMTCSQYHAHPLGGHRPQCNRRREKFVLSVRISSTFYSKTHIVDKMRHQGIWSSQAKEFLQP